VKVMLDTAILIGVVMVVVVVTMIGVAVVE
jgi:hypothetical protein